MTQPDHPEDQLPQEDTLDDRGVVDALDEGFSPPEHEPAHLRHGTTEAERLRGESLEDHLAAEIPEPDPYAESGDDYEEGADIAHSGERDPRAGRLTSAPGQGVREYQGIGTDIGIDGAGASAEEAAMHIIDNPEE